MVRLGIDGNCICIHHLQRMIGLRFHLTKKEFKTLKSNKNSTYEYNEVEHKWEMYITKINEYVANDSSSRNVKVIGITDYR